MSFIQQTKDNNVVSKVYYMRDKKRSASEGRIPKVQSLAVHLSSIIQKNKRDQLNQEMKVLAKRLDGFQPSDIFSLTQRPQTTYEIRNARTPLTRRQIHTSYDFIRSKKKVDSDALLISDIFNDSWNGLNNKKIMDDRQRFQRSQSRKETFKMRKVEFKTFVKDQEDRKKPKAVPQIHEVSYQKEELNKWGAGLPIPKMTSKLYANPCNSRFGRDRKRETVSKTKEILLNKRLQ